MVGWWLSPTPLKNDGVFVSWDDDIPNRYGKIEFMFPNHQPVIFCSLDLIQKLVNNDSW